MQTLDKNELNALLGKVGILDSPMELIAKIDYVGGIDGFDSLLNGQTQDEYGAVIHIIKRPKGLQIKLAKILKSHSVGLLDTQIKKVIIEHKDSIIKNKDKSVIGRAVIGGVLLGPLGAVIGGVSGLKKGQETIIPDSILILDCEIDNSNLKLIYSCNKNKLPETKSFFSKLGIQIEEIKGLIQRDIDSESKKIDNLERIANLFKEGVLTKEEFDREKKNLLD